jgi:predicted homoserine dehydrogenase-like protein
MFVSLVELCAAFACPSGSADDIPTLMRPVSEGGRLERKGLVEVVSCLTPDGQEIPHHVRQGVWVCLEGETEYKRNCFEEYNVVTDPSGRYAAMYKRFHLIGLELAVSVASVGLRGESTGNSIFFRADVSAIAKRDLAAGEILDGEGGYTVTGGLRPASVSVVSGYLPLGLAHHAKLKNPIKQGQPMTWADVKLDKTTDAYLLRRATESSVCAVHVWR